jgi:predicted  nucleic acid-binding Zn-ribbon protein
LKEVLKKLLELQKVDLDLQELENLKGDLPQQVRRLDLDREEAEKSLRDLELKYKDVQKERTVTEVDIRELEDKKKKFQNQLYEVKNNREYDAVTREIESVTAGISQKEGRLLELMGMEEDLKKQLEKGREAAAQLREQLGLKQTELEKKIAETENDETRLKNERVDLLKGMEPKLLSNYNRIRKAKSGLAVVPIVRNTCCGGCYKTLPPQRVLEIREKNQVFLCEVCGRMLVWDDAHS